MSNERTPPNPIGSPDPKAGAAGLPGVSARKLHPWDELPPEVLKPAHVYAAQRDWPGYFAAVAGKPARETLVLALKKFEEEVSPRRATESHGVGSGTGEADGARFAIDLAAGEGRDTAELLARGWRVLAIDGHPEAIARLTARPDISQEALTRLEVQFDLMEGLVLPPCDLLNASYALPFCDPAHFASLWAQIAASIRPGGRFAGQFFGERDGWASLPDRSHHTREQVLGMLSGFQIESMIEEDKDGKDALQHPKHWHVFHVVARKK